MGTNGRCLIDLTGERFGHWTVISKGVKKTSGDTYWLCRCDCGKLKEVRGKSLRRGRSTNCGCSNRWKRFGGAMGENPRLAKTWQNMMQRCYNSEAPNYHRYGGRGITVCDEWHDFRNFVAWAEKSGYDKNAPRGCCTIDRINNNAGYSPANCRWVSVSTQENNKRTNVYLTVGETTRTIAQWARDIGLHPSTVGRWRRVYGSEEAQRRIASRKAR